MTLRITARWEILDAPPSVCAQCGARPIPYLPRCVVCGEEVLSNGRELPFAPRELSPVPGARRIAHLSDLHIGQNLPASRMTPMATFRIWLERLRECQVDLLVLSGDVVERPGDTYGMTRARALLEDSGMAWLVVPGNHDIKRPGRPDAFYDIFGIYPRVETHAGIDFILLDSMAGLSMEERGLNEKFYGDYICYTEGRIGAVQYAMVDAQLEGRAQRERAVVLHHHVMRQHADLMPLTPRQAGITEDLFGTMKALMDADELFAWAHARGAHTIYHGHKHQFQQPGMREGNLLVLNAGSSTLREGSQFGRLIDHLPGRRIVSNLELLG